MTTESHTTGPDRHPEVAELSALGEGLLPPGRTAAVHDHLTHCGTCRDIHSSLQDIRGLLGSLPGPSAMPADVAGRIDAALAAEALSDAAATAVDVSRETRPASPLGAGAEGAGSHTVGTGAGNGATTTGAHVSRETSKPTGHAPGPVGPGRSRRRRRWSRALLATAAASALVVFGVLVAQLPGSSTRDASLDAGAGADEKSAAKAELSAATLEERVAELLSAPAPLASPEGSRADPEAELDAPRSDAGGQGGRALPVCVREALHRAEVPLAVDTDTFEGTPAYVVVLAHPGDARRVDTYVVDSTCTDDPARPGDLLLRETFQRP